MKLGTAPGLALAIASGLALLACGSDREAGTAMARTATAEVGNGSAVELCERLNAQLKQCAEPIVAAVTAERQRQGAQGPALEGQMASLRRRLNAPPSCAGSSEARLGPVAACASDDCETIAPCVAPLLAGSRPSATPANPEPASTARPSTFDGNVLFVIVDTVRADRLGVTGYRRNGQSLTPRLDAFARTATVFARAYAHGANTPRSLPTIWSSRYPSQIAYAKPFHNFPSVHADEDLLFERLAGVGLYTVGFSSHFYFAKRRNITQGFAEYDNEGARSLPASNKDFAAPRIVPKAIARLEQLAAERRRFAMFVHLFEPHSTYIEHDDYPVQQKGVAGLEEKYDYEVAVADRYVGELLDALDRTGQTASTMVVVLSDHGEAFGVHSFGGNRLYFHGQALYDEVLRVPLLIRLPGVAPSVSDQMVGLIDVAPTILDALGLPVPASYMGRSLQPLMRGEQLPSRALGAQMQRTPSWDYEATAYVAANGNEKVIVHGDGRIELFDLAADPEERRDLSRVDPTRTERLRAELEAWTEALARGGATERAP